MMVDVMRASNVHNNIIYRTILFRKKMCDEKKINIKNVPPLVRDNKYNIL